MLGQTLKCLISRTRLQRRLLLVNIVLRCEVLSSARSYEVAVLTFRFPAQSRGRRKSFRATNMLRTRAEVWSPATRTAEVAYCSLYVRVMVIGHKHMLLVPIFVKKKKNTMMMTRYFGIRSIYSASDKLASHSHGDKMKTKHMAPEIWYRGRNNTFQIYMCDST